MVQSITRHGGDVEIDTGISENEIVSFLFCRRCFATGRKHSMRGSEQPWIFTTCMCLRRGDRGVAICSARAVGKTAYNRISRPQQFLWWAHKESSDLGPAD